MRGEDPVLALDRRGRKATKPASGDVFEIQTSSGLGYLQYVAKSSVFCELIRVFPEGNIVLRTSPEAHIPLDDFRFDPELFK